MQQTSKQYINKWDDGRAQGWAIGISYNALLTLHRTKKMEWKLNGDIQTNLHLFHFKPCYVQLTGPSAPQCQCKHGFHDRPTHTSATVSSAGITAWGRWTTAHCCGHFTGWPKNNGRAKVFPLTLCAIIWTPLVFHRAAISLSHASSPQQRKRAPRHVALPNYFHLFAPISDSVPTLERYVANNAFVREVPLFDRPWLHSLWFNGHFVDCNSIPFFPSPWCPLVK